MIDGLKFKYTFAQLDTHFQSKITNLTSLINGLTARITALPPGSQGRQDLESKRAAFIARRAMFQEAKAHLEGGALAEDYRLTLTEMKQIELIP